MKVFLLWRSFNHFFPMETRTVRAQAVFRTGFGSFQFESNRTDGRRKLVRARKHKTTNVEKKNSWNTKNFFGLGNTILKPANFFVTKWKLVLGSAVIVYKLMYLKQLVFSHLYIKSIKTKRNENSNSQKFTFNTKSFCLNIGFGQ